MGMERSTGGHLVLASTNRGKLAEFQHLLQGSPWRPALLSDFNAPQMHEQVPETGTRFVENALLKATAAARFCDLPAIADDSGLAVDALGGAPGVYSARYAGENADDAANNRKLLEELRDVPEAQRTARYHCALVFLGHWQDPNPIICEAEWEGRILSAPRGEGGFGYDSLFFVPTEGCSAAELSAERKNAISHRGQAMAQLLAALKE